ncbi:MAG: NAD(P)-dependent alcohol dehydrogenase [Planctomycetes bacterium]|nr:NAD(P)-dependent alcohol dehydrogenase [Planctomycetota bacterium]
MSAVVHDHYGPLNQLRVREIPIPTIAAGQILVRVHAASLHAGDCMCVKGSPGIVRIATGLFRPKNRVPGFDVAGVVDAVGKDVTHFQPGDQVFGTCEGACADYAVVEEDRLALKPTTLSLQEAAAVPTSGLAALHGLRDAGQLLPGQDILINGAAGGVGHFAVQIAKSYGARVTGVCSAGNADMVLGLGADQVLDYHTQDFAADGARFDVIFDNVENRDLADCRAALKERGTYIANSGTGATGLRFLVRLFKPLLLSPFIRQTLKRYVSITTRRDLECLKDLIDAGKLRPVIGNTFTLAEVPDALALIDTGHSRGKSIINLKTPGPQVE